MSEYLKISDEVVSSAIYVVRGQKVMLDSDLAELYQVETKRLNEQVRRNSERFPEDFMFQLTDKEWNVLRSHFATSRWGGRRTLPYVFTEQGVSMLSSVLNSKIAIQVNIQIIRVFTKMREMLLSNKEMLLKIQQMESKVIGQDEKIELIFNYLKQFLKENDKPRTQIGFKQGN